MVHCLTRNFNYIIMIEFDKIFNIPLFNQVKLLKNFAAYFYCYDKAWLIAMTINDISSQICFITTKAVDPFPEFTAADYGQQAFQLLFRNDIC